MWSRKYVVLEICRPGENMSARLGENMSARKKKIEGAAPEPPRGGLRPPSNPPAPGTDAQTLLLMQRI
jgi:hypothetical protein